MAKKGREKNTKNKGKHSVLVERVKNKKRKEKEDRKARLKAITKAAQKASQEEK
ncbi:MULTISPECIES: hypothetical protein [Nonlabens]|uniref:Uncharacterized protein n=1 Tax=Nonlabens xylanidelens TaxID=191564 RepID=A0A2S6IKM5_9FLAO|nr:hypothetical protein [Nonlabens xylanidelens]PPK94787.1 hypothetical protein LY01_01539 [Nonlabens xylanidelens]